MKKITYTQKTVLTIFEGFLLKFERRYGNNDIFGLVLAFNYNFFFASQHSRWIVIFRKKKLNLTANTFFVVGIKYTFRKKFNI